MVDWGFNFVRLGVMWEAVERSPGFYNETYLEEVNKLINKLGEKGIYTLVDAHQDVFARKICGEGMPNFYLDNLNNKCPDNILPWMEELFGKCRSVESYNFRYDKDGNPLVEDCQKNSFYTYYTTPESIDAFSRLYSNYDGLQDKFIAFWDKVAAAFAKNPYVVGYDPINEPFPGDPYADPTLVTEHGKFDRTHLQPMYKKLFDVYQKHDISKAMYFEPAEFPDEIGVEGGLVFNLGFTEAPGGAEFLSS